MKPIVFTIVLLFTVATSAWSQSGEKTGEITLVGEIIDVKCYTTGMMGGRGPDHEDCALSCIKGGLPVGLLDEKSGEVYTIVPAKGMKGANTALLPFVAKKVRIRGSVMEKGGNRLLAYTNIEEAK